MSAENGIGIDLTMPPTPVAPGADLVRRRHPEWKEHWRRWQFLLDSFEGGDRYRQATYGIDTRGQFVGNLVRHKREYPDQREQTGMSRGYQITLQSGQDPAYGATDSDFELRRARTPVPTFVRDAIFDHLDEIYARDVKRTGPAALEAWWGSVDDRGDDIGDWMTETVAPLLLALGQLDILIDHPPAPDADAPRTRADVERLGLDRAVAAVILPGNMLWWRLDDDGSYRECLVQENDEDALGNWVIRYRHWTMADSTLYDGQGRLLAGPTPHPYGRIPIVRVFDRKKPRCRHVGQSQYESVAERQREYWNRDSELILSDTQQAHPLLQGPEDYVQADGTVPVGPTWLLPKKKNTSGTSVSYEGFDVVEFPKEGADSIRRNKRDISEDIDRETRYVKAAGAATTTKGTSEQSGISKNLDLKGKHNKLAKIARMLARAEEAIARLALAVLADGRPDPADLDAIEVLYPQSFELYTASDVAIATQDFLLLMSNCGQGMPETEAALMGRLFRLVMPGMGEDEYRRHESEIRSCIDAVQANKEALQEQAIQIRSDLASPAITPTISPKQNARGSVSDPTKAKQPPGQTGAKSATKRKPPKNPSGGKP